MLSHDRHILNHSSVNNDHPHLPEATVIAELRGIENVRTRTFRDGKSGLFRFNVATRLIAPGAG